MDTSAWEHTFIRVAGLVRDSIVDGEGLRFTVFTQGCPHHCPGCHNPQTWDYSSTAPGAHDITLAELAERIKADLLIDGITFSGGEPFEQAAELAELAKWAHSRSLNVWCYTGWTLDEILQRADMYELHLLANVDVLVDGRYVLEKRTLSLPWRGSRNQRLYRLHNGEILEVE